MSEQVALSVNGKRVSVPSGATVAVAIMLADEACRKSVTGESRGPLCGMGICFECRAVIDGNPHSRTCQVICQAEMKVRTNE
jgi:D-hydroxyproline dehydrogenase subunit gamma